MKREIWKEESSFWVNIQSSSWVERKLWKPSTILAPFPTWYRSNISIWFCLSFQLASSKKRERFWFMVAHQQSPRNWPFLQHKVMFLFLKSRALDAFFLLATRVSCSLGKFNISGASKSASLRGKYLSFKASIFYSTSPFLFWQSFLWLNLLQLQLVPYPFTLLPSFVLWHVT